MALPASQRKPDLALVKSCFTANQMSVLWMRLQQARGKEDMSVKKAWDSMCSMKVGMKAGKRAVLFDLLVAPPRTWRSRMLTMTEEVSQTQRAVVRNTPNTRG